MIATLTGTVASLGLDSLVLDVHGVGYLVRTTPAALAQTRLGADLTLHTEMVVREDSMTLFGFPSAQDADAFRIVQSVSGIGPRLALSVLAVMSPEDLARAVAAQDIKAISRTPGIGPKVASRMVLELGGRLAPPIEPAAAAEGSSGAPSKRGAEPAGTSGVQAQVLEALLGLGWPEKSATEAVSRAHEELAAASAGGEQGAAIDPATLLRSALRGLGGSR
ncbi:Holliday junction branch migration protein RuvA [Brachybacterium sp. JHP9]|uniref:Holliday junction branch migration complex subunit RuvA n=1 Tax=Brachybacterium equifaecis TaxID=2910770 RepID=A0ABT0R286_9MICO|nr:Holliday junction branch migration protein RuvA [Brachybacterium equifaecis]